MISSGMTICSFHLKQRFSRGDESIYGLNSSYVHTDDGGETSQFDNILEMIKQFLSQNLSSSDDEKNMKLFSIIPNSIKEYDTATYNAISFVVSSGAYGYEVKMTDRHTGEIKYKSTKDDANLKDFRCVVFVPKDVNEVMTSKGIMVFQSIGAYGIKTITADQFKRFFSELNLTFKTQSVSVRLFIEKLIEQGNLHKITLIQNKVSKDESDDMLISTGREEKVYIKPRLKQEWLNKLFAFLNGDKETDMFELNETIYDDITVSFNLGGNYRTVRLKQLDNLSIVEDIPDEIYNGGNFNDDKLLNYMIDTANAYKEKMVFTVDSED